MDDEVCSDPWRMNRDESAFYRDFVRARIAFRKMHVNLLRAIRGAFIIAPLDPAPHPDSTYEEVRKEARRTSGGARRRPEGSPEKPGGGQKDARGGQEEARGRQGGYQERPGGS